MSGVGKVQDWVQKAVADIAAFDGKLRKIDTEAEKKALSTLLAGNGLNQEDKDYIEGFMLEKGKTAKVKGEKVQKNEARTIKVPYTEPHSSDCSNTLNQFFNQVIEYFDKDGNLVKEQVLSEDGEITQIKNFKILNEKERETECIINHANGFTSTFKYIVSGEPGNFVCKSGYHSITKGEKLIIESQTLEDGTYIQRFYDEGIEFLHSIPKGDEMDEILKQTKMIEEIRSKDGKYTTKYYNSEGKILLTKEREYEPFDPSVPTDSSENKSEPVKQDEQVKQKNPEPEE